MVSSLENQLYFVHERSNTGSLILPSSIHGNTHDLTLVLLNPDMPCFANSEDPDQLASDEANWSGSALFVIQ